MGETSRVILISWILWSNLIVFGSQVKASNIEKFGIKVQESDLERVCNLCPKEDFLWCMGCFKGPDLTQDQLGNDDVDYALAAKMMRCTFSSTKVVQDVMRDYSNNSTGEVQAGASFCVENLEKTAESFQTAQQFWTYKKKDQTLSEIIQGQNDYYDCVEKIPEYMPKHLFHLLGFVRSRAEIARIIVESINL